MSNEQMNSAATETETAATATTAQSAISALVADFAVGKKAKANHRLIGSGEVNGKRADLYELKLGVNTDCKMDLHGRIRVAARSIAGLQAKGATRAIIAEKVISTTATEIAVQIVVCDK